MKHDCESASSYSLEYFNANAKSRSVFENVDLTGFREFHSRAPRQWLSYLLLLASCRLRVRALLSLSSRWALPLPLTSYVVLASLLPPVPSLQSHVHRCLETAGLFVRLHLAPSLHIQRSSTPHLLASYLPPASDCSPCSLVLGPWSLLLVHYRVSLSASISAAHLPARLSSNSTVHWSQPASAAGTTRLPYYHSSPQSPRPSARPSAFCILFA